MRRANKAAICIFFSFHLCVCRLLIQLTAFLFLFIEFSNQSAEEERDSSIHDSEKRQEREKKNNIVVISSN